MTVSGVSRINFFASLSLATDFALGQPQEFALRSAVLAARLAEAAGAADDDLRACVYQALLRYVGCNADTFLLTALLGDEYALRRDFARIDSARPGEVIGVVLRALRRRHAGLSGAGMVVAIARGLAQAPGESRSILIGHCEVARRIAARLGLPDPIQDSLHQLYERWDGKGLPSGLKAEAVAFPVRVVTLAQDALVLIDALGSMTGSGPSRSAAILFSSEGEALHHPELGAGFLAEQGDAIDRNIRLGDRFERGRKPLEPSLALRGLERPRESHVEAELLEDVGIAPAVEERGLPRRQPTAMPALALRLVWGRAKRVEGCYAFGSEEIDPAHRTRGDERDERPEQRGSEAADGNERVRRRKRTGRLDQRAGQDVLRQPERRHQSRMEPVAARRGRDRLERVGLHAGPVRLRNHLAGVGVVSEDRRAEPVERRSLGWRVIDRIARRFRDQDPPLTFHRSPRASLKLAARGRG